MAERDGNQTSVTLLYSICLFVIFLKDQRLCLHDPPREFVRATTERASANQSCLEFEQLTPDEAERPLSAQEARQYLVSLRERNPIVMRVTKPHSKEVLPNESAYMKRRDVRDRQKPSHGPSVHDRQSYYQVLQGGDISHRAKKLVQDDCLRASAVLSVSQRDTTSVEQLRSLQRTLADNRCGRMKGDHQFALTGIGKVSDHTHWEPVEEKLELHKEEDGDDVAAAALDGHVMQSDEFACSRCNDNPILRMLKFRASIQDVKNNFKGSAAKSKIGRIKARHLRQEMHKFHVYLQCGHAFCQTCIKGVRACSDTQESLEGIRCALCQAVSLITVPSRLLLSTRTAQLTVRQIMSDIMSGSTEALACPVKNNCPSMDFCPYRHNLRWELVGNAKYSEEELEAKTQQAIEMEARRLRHCKVVQKQVVTHELMDLGYVQLHLVEWVSSKDFDNESSMLKPELVEYVPTTMDGVNRLMDHIMDPIEYDGTMVRIVRYYVDFLRRPRGLEFRTRNFGGESHLCLVHDLMSIGTCIITMNYARPTIEELHEAVTSWKALVSFHLTKKIVSWLFATNCL